MGFLGGTVAKNPPANAEEARDTHLIPGLGEFPGVGHGNPPSILAWKIPRTEERGRQQPMGSKEPDTTELIHTYVALSAVPEINISHYYNI